MAECEGGRAVLVELPTSRLELTEWHPVRTADGRWRFPTLLGTARVRRCAHVYNLVLDRCHVPLVNGVPCVSLGHGLESDEVVRHAYWGTDAVLRDLQKLDGWQSGRVVVRSAAACPAAHAPCAQAVAAATSVAVC